MCNEVIERASLDIGNRERCDRAIIALFVNCWVCLLTNGLVALPRNRKLDNVPHIWHLCRMVNNEDIREIFGTWPAYRIIYNEHIMVWLCVFPCVCVCVRVCIKVCRGVFLVEISYNYIYTEFPWLIMCHSKYSKQQHSSCGDQSQGLSGPFSIISLHWRHNDHRGVSNHQASRLNSPETGVFPAQMTSYAENVSIWWRHHVLTTEDVVVLINCQTKRKHRSSICQPCSCIWTGIVTISAGTGGDLNGVGT